MLLGFVKSKSKSPIWTSFKEKGNIIFENVIWVNYPQEAK